MVSGGLKMFLTPLHEIDFQHVQAFCQTWPEGVRVEYKQELTQIPKVISSFANTVGGIWVIGVETEETTHRPKFPIQGINRETEVEERMTHACWQGINPPLTPTIKSVPLPSDPRRLVWVVRVPESIEAPHAIQNSTRVYIRVNSVTEPMEFADIDRIEFLLNRRRDPDRRRELMIEAAMKRAWVGEPCIRIIIGPTYPDRPRHTEDALARQLERQKMRRWRWRRIQQGFISISPQPMRERFEVNLYGMIAYAASLSEHVQSTLSIDPVEIIRPIAGTLYRAAFLLKEMTMNLSMRVSLEGIAGYSIITDAYDPQGPASNSCEAIENPLVAEKSFPRETLDNDFRTHVTDIVRQLMWAFDWADEPLITSWTAKILQSNWPKYA
jgi:Putative DNA-binding domain